MARRKPYSPKQNVASIEGTGGAVVTDLHLVDNVPQVQTVSAGFTPKGLAPAPEPGYTVYRVNRAISRLSHGENVYPVKNGLVDLPTNETWYADLINNGALTPV